ncbi:hypothetical protein ABFT23_07095 [Nocardioides sp. C4-1]|uniref:hypothetical protein n=1 Tax=Nocardioides sp. C4-1 TaxID=3151851 RepID=UPI0032679DE9
MIAAVIVACEVGFWVVLAAGLLLRYPGRRPRLGGVVLACVPLVDVVLLVAAAVDLHGGAEFSSVHGLAAAYLGFSLAFGHGVIRWADVRFAHRFAGGPPPAPKPAPGSRARRSALWREWFKVVLAVAIASVVLGLLSFVADADQREAVLRSAGPLWIVVAIWLVAGPLWEAGPRDPQPSRGR